MTLYKIPIGTFDFSVTTQAAVTLCMGVMLAVGVICSVFGLYKIVFSGKKRRSALKNLLLLFTITAGIALITLAVLIWTKDISIDQIVNGFLSKIGEEVTVRVPRSSLHEGTQALADANEKGVLEKFCRKLKELEDASQTDGVITHIEAPKNFTKCPPPNTFYE